jgi:hypothetical protein
MAKPIEPSHPTMQDLKLHAAMSRLVRVFPATALLTEEQMEALGHANDAIKNWHNEWKRMGWEGG